MYYYILYGKTVSSDLGFPQLIKADPIPEDNADIVIRAGTMREEIKRQEAEKKYEFGEKASWLANRTTWILAENGRRITYEPRSGGNSGYLRTYILGYGIAMLHMQRGEMMFHCAAVHDGGEAVLIAGESGSGKSTLTGRFLSVGYSLMADDMALVKVQDGKVMVYPAFPFQKLCRDAAVRKGYCLDDLIYADEKKDKFLVPYPGKFSLDAKPVRWMFCLKADAGIKEPCLEEITGIQKLYCCLGNLFLRKLLEKQKIGILTGTKCLEIASGIPMYMVGRPGKGNTEEMIWQMVQSCINCEKESGYGKECKDYHEEETKRYGFIR